MRGLNVCVIGPAALIFTAVAIALTPMTSNAAVPDTAGARAATTDITLASDDTTCQISDAAITWGVKESLRSYISGTIANGEWEASDGATYDTPSFGWSEGSGQLDAGRGTLAFDGTLRFTGHDGILDTILGGLELRFDGTTTATLIFDVSGTTQDGTPVDEAAVAFAAINISDITVTSGTATLDAAPVTLTIAGAEAFGTYPAEEPLDPITASFSATSDCMPAPTTSASARELNTVVALGVVAVAVAAGLVFFVARWRGTKRQPRDK